MSNKEDHLKWIEDYIKDDISNQYDEVEDIFLEFIDEGKCEIGIDGGCLFVVLEVDALHHSDTIREVSEVDEFISRVNILHDFMTKVKSCLFKLTENGIRWRMNKGESSRSAWCHIEVSLRQEIYDKQQKNYDDHQAYLKEKGII